MLDAHPDLAIPGESHFIVPMALQRGWYERADGFAMDAFGSRLVEDARFRLWHLPEALVLQALAEALPQSLADAIRMLYSTHAAFVGKRLYGDKTPGYVRHLLLLAELLPEARFLHVIRDGRDVALSLMETDWARPRATNGIQTMAEFWRANVELGLRAGLSLPPGRYREISYERLIEDPESELRGICRFFELSYAPEMLRYERRYETLVRSFRQPANHRSVALAPTRGLRDWRSQMCDEDLRRFDATAGELLARLGYDRSR